MSGKLALVPRIDPPIGSFGAPPRMYPRRAWLDGSVLTVQTQADVRQCDLAAARKVALRLRPTEMRGWCLVLSAYPQAHGRPVRLVLRSLAEGVLLSAEHLRVLAQIIAARPAASGSEKVARRLLELAETQDIQADWGFRSDPRGLSRHSP